MPGFAIGAFLFAAAGLPASEPVPEYQAKAAFMYNFLRFVEWPEEVFDNANEPFRIGVLGEDPFGSYLDDAVRDRTIDGRPVEVVRFSRLFEVEGVHMLFISGSERSRLRATLNRFERHPILTVADIDNFAELGGMVEFFLRDQKIAFRINRSSAERAGLSISAQLLNLAVVVQDS